MILSKYLNGIGGTVHGSFFRVADEVDTSKPPGSTSLDRLGYPTTFGEALQGIATGQDFVYSPNLTWFLLACGVWWIAPYQLQQDSLQEICKQRLIVNHGMVFGYVGFWHVACYWRQWAKRPFAENRPYSPRKVIHNIFYTWLGILQWTLTEVAILYCYQTNRIPYLEHPPSMVQTAVASLLVPAFRDIHFYFTHRFLHTSFMYKYIHSVHHRNTADIEPFSGLCMHPVEHLYYFTCYAPCLWLNLSPFILFWMGLHTILSPAASQSFRF
jgi:sterol desaturase/sphingolipid hydroxylase (fatty acid hydroxylase superfamily)